MKWKKVLAENGNKAIVDRLSLWCHSKKIPYVKFQLFVLLLRPVHPRYIRLSVHPSTVHSNMTGCAKRRLQNSDSSVHPSVRPNTAANCPKRLLREASQTGIHLKAPGDSSCHFGLVFLNVF